jgi:hypothetical protein
MAKRQKKSASKHGPDNDPVDAEFVVALLGLCYQNASDPNAGKNEYSSLNDRDKLEVRAVASGLICIQQLLRQELKRVFTESIESPVLGNPSIFHAHTLINSLFLGFDHPVWRHVANVHKVLRGRGPRAMGYGTQQALSLIANMVLAVEAAMEREGARPSRRKAIAMVSKACSKIGAMPWARGTRLENYTAQRIKDFMDRGEILPANVDVPARLLARAEIVKGEQSERSLADRVIAAGLPTLRFIYGVPIPDLEDLPQVEQ